MSPLSAQARTLVFVILGAIIHIIPIMFYRRVVDVGPRDRQGLVYQGNVLTVVRKITHTQGDEGWWHESHWCTEVYHHSVEGGRGEGRFMWISPRDEVSPYDHFWCSLVCGFLTGITEYDCRRGLYEEVSRFGEVVVLDLPMK